MGNEAISNGLEENEPTETKPQGSASSAGEPKPGKHRPTEVTVEYPVDDFRREEFLGNESMMGRPEKSKPTETKPQGSAEGSVGVAGGLEQDNHNPLGEKASRAENGGVPASLNQDHNTCDIGIMVQ